MRVTHTRKGAQECSRSSTVRAVRTAQKGEHTLCHICGNGLQSGYPTFHFGLFRSSRRMSSAADNGHTSKRSSLLADVSLTTPKCAFFTAHAPLARRTHAVVPQTPLAHMMLAFTAGRARRNRAKTWLSEARRVTAMQCSRMIVWLTCRL